MNRKKCSSARFSSRIPEEGNHSQSSNSEEEPISDAERQQEESSDEEFYVHKALQPLRKSKSSAAGFASTASSANNFDQTATIIPLNRRSSRKVWKLAKFSLPSPFISLIIFLFRRFRTY